MYSSQKMSHFFNPFTFFQILLNDSSFLHSFAHSSIIFVSVFVFVTFSVFLVVGQNFVFVVVCSCMLCCSIILILFCW